jgi:hypothetical protein
MDAIDAEQISLHREAEDLLIAKFINHDRLQEAAIHDIQHVEGLASSMNALARLELDMLEVMVVIPDESTRRNAKEITDIVHI